MDNNGYNEILTWDINMDIWGDIHLGYNRITWDYYEDKIDRYKCGYQIWRSSRILRDIYGIS